LTWASLTSTYILLSQLSPLTLECTDPVQQKGLIPKEDLEKIEIRTGDALEEDAFWDCTHMVRVFAQERDSRV
jgi:hypothetical protein